MADKPPQRFLLWAGGHYYVLEVAGPVRHDITLTRDGEQIAHKKSMDERITVSSTGGGTHVDLRITHLGRVRRATLRTGGRALDMDPEPGSRNARRLERERVHPLRYAALDVLIAIAGVVLPLLGLGALFTWLLAPIIQWLLALLPHVELPSIPWPTIDWPDLPSIPWPHIPLPHWTPPAWLVWLLDKADLIWPVLFAAGYAWYEVRRRRRQDELKAAEAEKDRRRLLVRLAADLRAVRTRRAADVAVEHEGAADVGAVEPRGDEPPPG